MTTPIEEITNETDVIIENTPESSLESKPFTPPTPPEPEVPFNLLATVQYQSYPERSLFLIHPHVGNSKWYRQGDRIGHFTIREVKSGSVILYKDNKAYKELAMQPNPDIRSLIKK